jgi:hypothetical protein
LAESRRATRLPPTGEALLGVRRAGIDGDVDDFAAEVASYSK